MSDRRIIGVWVALFLNVLAGGCVSAAATNSEPVPQPFVRTPSAGTRWTIEVKPVAREAAPAATKTPANVGTVSIPIRMETRIGANQVGWTTTEFSDGRREECYTFRGQMFRRFDNSKKIATLPSPPLFPGLHWFPGGSIFAGKETVATKPCDKFKATAAYLRSINWPEDTVCVAWISIEDRYPVQIQDGETLYQISPISPFPQEIPLPAEFLAAAEKSSAQQQALQMMQKLNHH